mgnify:CR=1 FL=1
MWNALSEVENLIIKEWGVGEGVTRNNNICSRSVHSLLFIACDKILNSQPTRYLTHWIVIYKLYFPIHPFINYWGQDAETDSPQLRNKHSSFIPDPHAKVKFNVIKKNQVFLYLQLHVFGRWKSLHHINHKTTKIKHVKMLYENLQFIKFKYKCNVIIA